MASAPSAPGPATAGSELLERWRAASVFVVVGSTCVVVGGLVAAVTGPAELEHGSWLAAYLVLVGGVAQIGLGAGQAWLASTTPSTRSTRIQAWSWNAGMLLVAIGTLASAPILTTVGGAVSAVALGLFATGARPVRPSVRTAGFVYRSVVVIVAVSIPVGVVLAWLRHG